MNMNQLYFAGHAGKDAEVFQSKTGQEMVRFSICCSTKSKDGKEYATWLPVVCSGNWVNYGKSVKKGDNVFVSGSLNINSYESEGGKKTSVSIFPQTMLVKSAGPKVLNLEKTEIKDFDEIPF